MQFTVTVGTPLAGSKLPLSSWLKAAHLLNANDYVSVREVEQSLGVTYKTAWHMVRKLLSATENYRGPLKVFGKTVRKHVEPHLPKNRNSKAAWARKLAQKQAGTYTAPRVPTAAGVLSSGMFTPVPTKAHLKRTECFLGWILSDG